MTANVQLFIEKNIDIIEQQDWEQLFDTWYKSYAKYSRAIDNAELKELFDILKMIGVLPQEHRYARENILRKYFNKHIATKRTGSAKTVSAIEAINGLYSYLGISAAQLKAMFVDICTKRGFEVYSDGTKGRFILQ